LDPFGNAVRKADVKLEPMKVHKRKPAPQQERRDEPVVFSKKPTGNWGDEDPKPSRGKGRKEEPAKKPLVDRNAPEREVAAELVQGDVVAVEDLVSGLQKAITAFSSVDLATLTDGLAKLEIEEGEEDSLTNMLAKSIFTDKISLAEVITALQAHRSEKELPGLLIKVMVGTKDKKGERPLVEAVRAMDTDVLGIIAPGLEGDKLDTFLEKNGLLCIKPIPVDSLLSWVEDALGKKTSAKDILSHVNKQVDAKISVVDLAPVVAKHTMAIVYADASKPALGALDEYAQLLVRVLNSPPDLDAQRTFLFAVQKAWYEAGKGKGKEAKEMMIKIFDLKICAVEAFVMWKEDTKDSTPGKMKLLLKVNSWLETVLPKPVEEDYDEGDDSEFDDGDGGDY
jgi:hypothetical protein